MVCIYFLSNILMGINLKDHLVKGVEKVKTASKKAVATMATVAALSGVLTSCNKSEVQASGNTVTAGFEYIHSNGSADPTIYQYNVEVKKVGDKCIATLDGDGFDDHEFVGTTDEVFAKLSDFLGEKAELVTQSAQVSDKTLDKIDQMRAAYDSIANLKK